MRLLIALFLVCVSMVHGWDYKGDYEKDILKAVKKDNIGTCLKMDDGTYSPSIPTVAWEVNGRVIKEQYTTLDGRVYVVSFKYGGWKYEDTKEYWDQGRRILNEAGKVVSKKETPTTKSNLEIAKIIVSRYPYDVTPDYYPDGILDCTDVTIYFYEEWLKLGGSKNDIRMIWNITPAGNGISGMNHTFIQIKVDGKWKSIEAGGNLDFEGHWAGIENYDPANNKDVTWAWDGKNLHRFWVN